MEISVIFGLINGIIFIVFSDAVFTYAVGEWTELGDARARFLTRLITYFVVTMLKVIFEPKKPTINVDLKLLFAPRIGSC
jgi:hypothetical protein